MSDVLQQGHHSSCVDMSHHKQVNAWMLLQHKWLDPWHESTNAHTSSNCHLVLSHIFKQSMSVMLQDSQPLCLLHASCMHHAVFPKTGNWWKRVFTSKVACFLQSEETWRDFSLCLEGGVDQTQGNACLNFVNCMHQRTHPMPPNTADVCPSAACLFLRRTCKNVPTCGMLCRN